MTTDFMTEGEDKCSKELGKPKLPDWNEVPEYGIEALISTIDDQRELIAAIRREARWHESLRDADSSNE
jgi:hypothetical protein